MSRVINSDLPSQKRKKILVLISNSFSIIGNDNLSENDRNDLIAFIILSLSEIEKTITQTTAPWEKRAYWIKADQFRNEWQWVGEIKTRLMQSRSARGWVKIPTEIMMLAEKLKMVEPSKRLQEKNYWKGAYSVLFNQE